MDLCRANTEYVFKKDKTEHISNFKLNEISEFLKIPKQIEWIESYDISHAGKESEVVLYIQKMERKRNFIGLIISVKPTQVMISVLCSRLLKESFLPLKPNVFQI